MQLIVGERHLAAPMGTMEHGNGQTGKIFSPGQRGKARGLTETKTDVSNAIASYRGPFHHDFVDILMSTSGTFSSPGGEERQNDIER